LSEHPVVHKLQLKILISDRTRHGSPLWSEHGLSVVAHCTYSEDREPVTILFDTGASASLLRHNLETEGPPTTDIDTVFLSHCHRDHTGGLSALLDDTDATFNLIAHPDITRRAFNLREGMKEVGPEPEVWEKIPRGRLLLVREPVQIHPGVWVSGSIPRETEFERPRPNMYTLSDGRLIPDTDPDDMALWFRLRDEGLVVLTGCGHSGIVNTIRHAAEHMETEHFRAVVGGFHLIEAKPDRISSTTEGLAKFDVQELITGHCTGRTAEDFFARSFGESHNAFCTGDRYQF